MTLASHWRTRRQRLSLTGEVCPHCQAKLYPPRDVCPKCGGPAKEAFQFSGRGTVYSYATLYSAPADFAAYAPYMVALVKLEEGPLMTAQLTDVERDQVYVGMPVEMVTRRMREEGQDGLVLYNAKFRPALQTVAA